MDGVVPPLYTLNVFVNASTSTAEFVDPIETLGSGVRPVHETSSHRPGPAVHGGSIQYASRQ